jgi:ribA/ribD-fused uncharacterized protein
MVTNHYGNMGHGPIFFYNRDEPYYEFTNFYQAPIDLDGKTWPTTEHYFQAQKFIGTSYLEVIRNFDRPRQAFDLSRNPTVSRWRRKDWEDIKIDIMRKALLAKFTQHKPLRQMLLGTGDNMLVEHTPHDKFWGNGGDGSGQNHLGMLLMEIRHDLKTLQASLRQENDHARSHINPDSHRERVQRSNSTEKDGANGSSSSSSCSMEYTISGADKSNPSSDLTRPPLHPVVTGNTGGTPSSQQPGEAQSTSEPHRDPPVGNLIDLEAEPPEEDTITSIITGGVPMDLPDKPILPTPPAPSPHTTPVVGQWTTPAAPDTCTSTDAGKGSSSKNEGDEDMDTNEIS